MGELKSRRLGPIDRHKSTPRFNGDCTDATHLRPSLLLMNW